MKRIKDDFIKPSENFSIHVILVTGGTGFIGTTLIEKLLASGHQVRAIKRSLSSIPSSLKDKDQLTWVEADLHNFFSLEDAFEGISQVYHCAALVSYEPKDHKNLMKTNIEGTTHIVNLCLQNKARLIHVSSVSALGNTDSGGMISEKTRWEWNKRKSGYSVSKYEAEREVWRGIAEGLDAVIVKPSLVIGNPADDPKSRKIKELIEKGLKFYPLGSTGIVDVEDVVKSMIMLMERTDISGESFIINAENINYRDLFAKYSELLGVPAPKIPAGRCTLSIAWRLHRLLKMVGLTNSGLTKDLARISIAKNRYTNEKLLNTLGISFTPIGKSLFKICAKP